MRKIERAPKLGDRVRVYVDESMIDEPGVIIRVGRDGEIALHLWPDSDTRVAMSGVQWFADEPGARAFGLKGAWPE